MSSPEAAYGNFRAASYAWRLYSGDNVLDQLGAELDRAGARRAFVICGRTVGRSTDLIGRVRAAIGERLAGVFDGMDKDSSFPAVVAATDAARAAQADLLIAVGGGSVVVGTRAVAIFLAERGSPFELMTQYPEGKPAFSPRLEAPKLPIVNVLTTPTTAMNRAGTGLKNNDLDHRMEYFDPKTRPAALFWDSAALLTAPAALIRSTGTNTFTLALRSLTVAPASPLAEGDRLQAFRLARRSLVAAIERPDDAAPRIDLCAAALLANRAADDDAGRRTDRDPISAGSYALATALHLRYGHVGQGEATAALIPTVARNLDPRDVETARRLAEALEVWREGMAPAAANAASAAALAHFYESIGVPARVRDLAVPAEDLARVAQDALKNFNANPGERSADAVEALLALLQAAW